VFLVFLVALRLWWGWEANRRLQAEIDRIIAAGEPIYPEDFDPKEKIPDDQNAAKLYVDAQDAFSLNTEQTKAMEVVLSDDAAIGENVDLVRSIIEDSAEALRLVRRARQLTRVDWGLRFRSPVINAATFGSYMGEHQLGKLLNFAAIHHAYAGNESEAVEMILDALALTQCLRQQPIYMAQVIAGGIEFEAIRVVEELVLVSHHPAPDAAHPATDQLRQLLQSLSDDAAVKGSMRQSWLAERMGQLDRVSEVARGAASINAMFGGRPTPPARPDLLWEIAYRPAFKLDMVTLSRETRRRVEEVERSVYIRPPDRVDTASLFGLVLRPYSSILFDSHNHGQRLYFRHLAWRRLGAIGLAVRLFRAEHGHFPAALEDLVPQYLPKTPADPFGIDRRLMSYLPDADPPIVYSIAVNGVDDGGRFVQRGGYMFGWKLDFPFFLNGSPPEEKQKTEPQPTTSGQTEEDADDGEDAERQGDEEQESEEKPEGG